jgi:hypothetical protein
MQAELVETADVVAMVGEIRDMFIDHLTVVTTDGWVSDAVRAFMKGGEHGLRRYILRWIDGSRHDLADRLDAIADEAAGAPIGPMYRNRH